MVDWSTAHGVAQRLPAGEGGVLARFPRKSEFESALAHCLGDAGAEVSPFYVAELSGDYALPALEHLWDVAGAALAEVPYEERRATHATESTTLSAWTGGERLDVSLPPGCNPPTNEAATGLANVVLRAQGSPVRFYALPLRRGVGLFMIDQSRARCLFDVGLLAPSLPASLQQSDL